ncbi:MAG: N-acetylglucosamine-6-phosphate deacetylase [Sphaerochaeta sp.]|nr:N-acetylglucosamine-6-phosphate deacetylase [Sphaerochaeta sp.]
MRIDNATIYHRGKFILGSIRWDGKTITAIGEKVKPLIGEETFDAEGNYLVPGFLDVHTHGGNRIDINHIRSTSDIDDLSRFFASKGITGFLASVVSDTKGRTEEILRTLTSSIAKGTPGSELLGIHLEGPFISCEYRGAMPEALLLDGDADLLEHYLSVADNKVLYLTVAPELPGVIPLIRKYKDRLVIAIGHSGADYETSMEAIEAGATSCTHIFNAMKLFHMHRPAITGAALESDIYCEAICDGFHLVPATVRLLLKTKGYDKVVAITDSMMAAGLPDGLYKLGSMDVEVVDGDAKLLDGVRAGSTLTMDKALMNLMTFTGKSLEQVLPLLTENPARMLHLYDTKGSLEIGKDADFTLLDPTLHVVRTYVCGNLAYAGRGITE